MEKINFTDTVVVKKPYVEINGIEYEVQDGTYNGGTDLNSKTFNQLQTNIENAIKDVASNCVFTGMLPANYDLLDLYNSIGLKISIIDNEALKYVNFPSGAYGYGVLITICNSIGASWNNAQIYIADNIGTSDVLGGLYIRTKDSTWIRITGTVGIANTTAS